MQFKYPELLYALFLLLIPIFIHLFQLRRFKKIDFTNVAFLKKVTLQTRKSSQLKKWLTLLLRLLAFACIILAFAQPFKASKTALSTQKETVIYLDNSFSMQAKGQEGPLLQRAIQQLYEQKHENEKIHWFTNNFEIKNSSLSNFKNEILKVPYTHKQLKLSEVVLKANTFYSKNKQVEKRLIIISDFQIKEGFPEIPKDLKVDVVQLKPVNTNNISIDSVYISKKNIETTQLKVVVSKQGDVNTNIPVSLFNDKTLVAKTTVNFEEQQNATITFDIENKGSFKGMISLKDPNLLFDNNLFFAINTPQKIKVLSINQAKANFLQRIFNSNEFDYTQQSHKSLDYSKIPDQNFIILNELSTLPESLIAALQSFTKNGGSLFVLPSENVSVSNYNQLLSSLQLGNISEKIEQEKKVTKIIFSHPLFVQVFEKQIDNFQYPKVNSFYKVQTLANSVLQFEDQKPFIIQKNNSYLCTAAINTANSNFQSSPLIVPTIYNMALQSLPLTKLYYTIGKQNKFSVPIKLLQNEILLLKDSISQTIPLQQTKANQVNIITNDEPSLAGIYSIEKEKEYISCLSFNFPREESILRYENNKEWKGVNRYSSVFELFNTISEENLIQNFWKWFAIFAVLFLLLEMLVLKFLK